MKISKSTITLAAASAAILLCPPARTGLRYVLGLRREEEPAWVSELKDGRFGVRAYPELIVATTTAQGDRVRASGQCFRRLAGYIFGRNRSRTKMPMTAPVFMQAETGARPSIAGSTEASPPSDRLPMTAPVTMVERDSSLVMGFVMPSGFSLETLPEPVDERVCLTRVPARLLAVVQFSGRLNERAIDRNTSTLRHWLEKHGYVEVGPPQIAGYDPPFTLPFRRRNEVQIPVAKRRAGEVVQPPRPLGDACTQ